MFNHKSNNISFRGVALALILFGATILALGLVFYLFNLFFGFSFVSPSYKIIGGTIILALGYVILELELFRQNK